jgi:hypothetical protein
MHTVQSLAWFYLKFCLYISENMEVVTLTLFFNAAFIHLKYPMMRGPDLAAAAYSTPKSSVLPLYEVSSLLNLCATK